MNYPIILRLQSVILFALTAAFAASLGIALLYRHEAGESLAITGFLVSTLVAGTLSATCFFFASGSANQLFRREALLTIGSGWILASVVGALPYFLILPETTLADAFFESASGFTTTGASVLSNLEDLPRSLLFWRSISQWFGGLGVVVFFVAVLSFLGAGAKVLFSRESSAQAADLDTSRVQQGVVRLVYLYLALSGICTVVYWLCGLDWFDAVNHMFTTLSTGGFGTRSNSIADFNNPALEWAIIAFMTIGGTSFIVIIRTLRGDRMAIARSTEVKAYLLLLLGASALIALFLWIDHPDPRIHDVVRASTFQVVSIMTTTGFATADFDLWMPVTHVLLLALMFVGGCTGSTAGGVKVIRVVVATKIAARDIEKSFRARLVRPIKVNGEPFNPANLDNIVIYIVLVGILTGASTLLVALFEPSTSLEGIVSATFACLFNIGPGLAEVGPTRNFAPFTEVTKLFLALLMIIGRLELYAVLALFVPSMWKK